MARCATLLALSALVVTVAAHEIAHETFVDPTDLAAANATKADQDTLKLKDVEDSVPKPSDILKSLKQIMTTQLKNDGFQWLNAVVALVLGVVMLVSGEFVFKYLVVGFITLFVFLLSINIMTAHYSQFPVAVNYGFSTEVALFVGAVSYTGYEGIQLLIGGIAGSLLFSFVHSEFKEHVSEPVAGQWYFFLVGINLSLVLCIVFFWVRKWHTRAMAVVSSVAGGLLFSSALSFFVMLAAVANRNTINKKGKFDLKQGPIFWIDFFWMTVGGSDSPDVGLFQNWAVKVGANPISLDTWIGRGIWFIFAILGIWVQRRNEKTRGKKQTNQSQESNLEPLLP